MSAARAATEARGRPLGLLEALSTEGTDTQPDVPEQGSHAWRDLHSPPHRQSWRNQLLQEQDSPLQPVL